MSSSVISKKRSLLFAIIPFALSLQSCAVSDARGPISATRLQQDYPAFSAVTTDAEKSLGLQEAIAQHSGLSIKVFFGTWCSDSQREVPQLLSLIQPIDSRLLPVEMIALDRSKVDDEKQTEHYQVQRIPSIIVLQNGKEIGRITETVTVSVADDLRAIIDKAV